MKIEIKMRVLNDEEWPVYENKYVFNDPEPTVEVEDFKGYRFVLNYAEPKEGAHLINLMKSEKIPEGKNREKAGEFSTKINQDLGILGE